MSKKESNSMQKSVLPLQRAIIKWVAGAVAVAAISLGMPNSAYAGWQTITTGSEFGSYTAFEAKYAYAYPWGTDHNGRARMVCTSTNHTNLFLSGNVMTEMAAPCSPEGNSTESPFLAIHYHSG